MEKFPRGVILDYIKYECYAMISEVDRIYLQSGDWVIHERHFFRVITDKDFKSQYRQCL